MEKIFESVKFIIYDNMYVNLEDILFDSKFIDLNLDDLDIADLLMSVEEEFDVEFNDEEYNSLKTVNELCELIYKKTKKDF